LIQRLEKVHQSSIFACAWNRGGSHLLTCGADGFVRLLDAKSGTVVHEWDVVTSQLLGQEKGEKVPLGAMLLGCTFIEGDVPVAVGFNGQIALLPMPSSVGLESAANALDKTWIITGHQAPISAMALGGPGSNSLYTSDTDGVIVEWDVSQGTAWGRVYNVNEGDPDISGKVHAGATVSALTMSGGTLYSAGWDDSVRTTNKLVCDGQLKMEAQPNALVSGTSLVVAMTVDGLVLIQDKQILSELVKLPYTATAVCLSKDDSTLFVGGDDCNIYVYSVSSGNAANPLTETHVIKGGHLKAVASLALSPDGTQLAAADVRDVCVYNTNDYSTVVAKGRWCFHTQRIGCLAWSPDGSVLASGGNDDNIFLWYPAKKMKRVHYKFAHRGGVTGLSFVGNNASGGGDWMLISAGADGCVNWWNVEEDAKKKFGL